MGYIGHLNKAGSLSRVCAMHSRCAKVHEHMVHCCRGGQVGTIQPSQPGCFRAQHMVEGGNRYAAVARFALARLAYRDHCRRGAQADNIYLLVYKVEGGESSPAAGIAAPLAPRCGPPVAHLNATSSCSTRATL
jgi:hypothetical protein